MAASHTFTVSSQFPQLVYESVPSRTFQRVFDAATGAESARAVVARLEAQAAPGEDLSDPVTQLHVTHLNTGEVGRWRRELPPAFVARLEQAFGRAMAAYGYGRDGGAAVPSAAQSPRA